jgi:hypothetical protein
MIIITITITDIENDKIRIFANENSMSPSFSEQAESNKIVEMLKKKMKLFPVKHESK